MKLFTALLFEILIMLHIITEKVIAPSGSEGKTGYISLEDMIKASNFRRSPTFDQAIPEKCQPFNGAGTSHLQTESNGKDLSLTVDQHKHCYKIEGKNRYPVFRSICTLGSNSIDHFTWNKLKDLTSYLYYNGKGMAIKISAIEVEEKCKDADISISADEKKRCYKTIGDYFYLVYRSFDMPISSLGLPFYVYYKDGKFHRLSNADSKLCEITNYQHRINIMCGSPDDGQISKNENEECIMKMPGGTAYNIHKLEYTKEVNGKNEVVKKYMYIDGEQKVYLVHVSADKECVGASFIKVENDN